MKRSLFVVFSLLLLIGAGTLAAAPKSLSGLVPTPAPAMQEPVGDAGAFVLGNRLYVAGGWAGVTTDPSSSLLQSTLMEGRPGEWSQAGLPVTPPRFGMSVVNTGGRGYLIGGYSGGALAQVQSFDGSGWRDERSLPKAINYPGAAAARGRIFVAGGVPGPYADVWSATAGSDGRLGTWESEKPLPRQMITQLVAVGDCLFVVGGRGADARSRQEVYRAIWNAAGHVDAWDDSPPDLPQARAWHAVAVRNDVVYVLGGTADGVNYSQQYFSARVDAQCNLDGWSSGDLPDARGRIAAVGAGEGLYWMGGQRGTVQGSWANDVWYDLPLPTPTPTSTPTRTATPTITPTPTIVPPQIQLMLQQRLIPPGDVLEYEISYRNTGGAAAEDVVIMNVVPDGVEYQDGADATYNPTNRTISWALPAVPPGSPTTVTYRVLLPTSAAASWQAPLARQAFLPAPAGMVSDTETPTLTPTALSSPSATPSATLTLIATAALTPTETLTPTLTPVDAFTLTPTATVTPTPTLGDMPTSTATATLSSTFTPSPTATPTNTLTPSPTATHTFTPTPRAPIVIVNEGASATWKYKGTAYPPAVSNPIVFILFGRQLYVPLILKGR